MEATSSTLPFKDFNDKNKRQFERSIAQAKDQGDDRHGGGGGGGGDPIAAIQSQSEEVMFLDPLAELLVFLVSVRLAPALLAALNRFVTSLAHGGFNDYANPTLRKLVANNPCRVSPVVNFVVSNELN